MKIKQLSPTIINRIAAGEVIERPASAVKELVENAIDAKADSILITIEAGGHNLIIIEDSGSGMIKEELELAVDRHTTSKLNEEDLFNIESFGFRGEALASIGSVSRLKISSKTADCEYGHYVFIEGGMKHPTQPANINLGTKVEVRDLFFAIPARLKFLKNPRIETQHVINIIQKIALAHPEISFSLIADNKQVLQTKPHFSTDKLSRIAEIFGKNLAENLIALNYHNHDIKLTGYISLATHNFRNSEYIYCYVNNRPVKDKLIQQAVRIAYQDVMPRDRFPAVFLFIEIPNYDIDVNVHPAKTEVRFKNESLLKSIIISAIRDHLVNVKFNTTSSGLTEKLINKAEIEQINENFITSPKLNFNPTPNYQQFNNVYKKDFSIADNQQIKNDNSYQHISASSGFQAQVNPIPEISIQTHLYPLGLAKCQIDKTYIIAENEEGLIIVDQHAAHERIIYEQYKQMLKKEGIATQRLLIPEIIYVNSEQHHILKEHQPHLNDLGLILIFHEDEAVEVIATPSAFGTFNLEKLLNDLAADLIEFNQTTALEEIFEHIYETLACHSSIRAGRIMNNLEMNNLLRQIETTNLSAQCNHGRPTFIKFKFSDIESLFGRS